jgi:predicted lysophospholipase L1 biosynthesis ABC-type transport system permease subunit
MHGAMQLPRFAQEPFTLVPAGAGVDMPGSARPKYARALVAVFVIVVLVLLVACANIANLLIARGVARRHEVAVLLALGASRWRLARQLIVESLVLSGIGAAGGLLLAVWASRALVAELALDLDTALDWRALAFTATIATVTALLFGSGAAVRSVRVAPMDVLKQQGRTATAGRGGLSAGLVLATSYGVFAHSQMILPDTLMVASGLIAAYCFWCAVTRDGHRVAQDVSPRLHHPAAHELLPATQFASEHGQSRSIAGDHIELAPAIAATTAGIAHVALPCAGACVHP